jgi:hypothetical protein
MVSTDSLGRHQLLAFLGPLEWGEQNKIAARFGIESGYFARIMLGKRRPGLDVASKIEANTGGRVPASSWSKPAPKKAVAKKAG